MTNPKKTYMTTVDKPNLKVNGIITARLTNGRHYTYRLKAVASGPLEGRRIAELLIGPNNEQDYVGWAFITEEGGLQVWKKKDGEAYRKHVQLLMGLAQDVVEGWFQASKCSKCGKLLTDYESISIGMGPICRLK